MRLAVVDCETTGLPLHPSAPLDRQPHVIEFGARIVSEKGLEDEHLQFLCDPGIPLEDIITKITGLTDEDLAGQKSFGAYLPIVQKFLDGADGIVAHNLPFDSYVIWCEVLRQHGEKHWQWPRIQICTSQMFEPVFGYRPKLVTLYQFLMGEKLKQTHRALDDVDALANIVAEGGIIEALKDPATEGSYGVFIPEDICPD